MDEIAIKHEIPSFDIQCRSCLSIGRKLIPLGNYTNIFRKIVSDMNIDYQAHLLSDNIQLCWECIAILRRVYIFQQQCYKAQEKLFLGQHLYSTLSTLTTIILNDSYSHTVYMTESIMDIDIKPKTDQTDASTVPNLGIDLPNIGIGVPNIGAYVANVGTNLTELGTGMPDFGNDFSDGEVKSEGGLSIVEFKAAQAPNKPRSTRWYLTRQLQNKKPKFKIISDHKDSFIKVPIKADILTFLNEQRESDYYKRRRYKCILCVAAFSNNKTLVRHKQKYHNKESSYVCDICTSNLPSKRVLCAHVRAHYYSYSCALCHFWCAHRSLAEAHYRSQHKRLFQCLKCRLKFSNRKEFYKHHKAMHEKFICDHCGVSFKMRYCIKEHIRKQHSPFICKLCNKRYAHYSGLCLHNRTTHAPGIASAYCVECDKWYPDMYRYKWHLANSVKHNGNKSTAKKKAACPDCGKIYSRRTYMMNHYRHVHTNQSKHYCQICQRAFLNRTRYVDHMRTKHEGVKKEKNKICNECGRGFSTNRILINHIRTHSGERPFECEYCSAKFTQKHSMLSHVKYIHLKNKRRSWQH